MSVVYRSRQALEVSCESTCLTLLWYWTHLLTTEGNLEGKYLTSENDIWDALSKTSFYIGFPLGESDPSFREKSPDLSCRSCTMIHASSYRPFSKPRLRLWIRLQAPSSRLKLWARLDKARANCQSNRGGQASLSLIQSRSRGCEKGLIDRKRLQNFLFFMLAAFCVALPVANYSFMDYWF